jgi:hypothetical protein
MQRTRGWLARALFASLVALAAVGPPTPTSASEWVQNFVAVELWSGPDAGAISFGSAPQWDYFQIISAPTASRLHVLVARTNNFAFVDARAVGPSGPPPVGWPGPAPRVEAQPRAAPPPLPAPQPASPAVAGGSQASIELPRGLALAADQALWPALQALQSIQHTWTIQALSLTGTRLEWALLPRDAAGAYQPSQSLISINVRWYRSDPRALAAVIEHEAKHVADRLAGLDIESTAGCITTEINAFSEEAKTWGELVGPAGKLNPQDDLDRSLNFKLAMLRQNPDGIRDLIVESVGYQNQCHLVG